MSDPGCLPFDMDTRIFILTVSSDTAIAPIVYCFCLCLVRLRRQCVYWTALTHSCYGVDAVDARMLLLGSLLVHLGPRMPNLIRDANLKNLKSQGEARFKQILRFAVVSSSLSLSLLFLLYLMATPLPPAPFTRCWYKYGCFF